MTREWVLVLAACASPTRAPEPVPVPQPSVTHDAAVELPIVLAAGRSHTCVLERGEVSCWGKNDQGQLGDGTKASSAKPVRVVGLPPAIAITLGDDHSCAIVRDGNVYCWGRGGEGQLAQTPPVDSAKPIAIGLVAKDLAAGHQHTCAVLGDGGVACWGHSSYGELGGADASKRVPNITDATQVRVGASTTCVL